MAHRVNVIGLSELLEEFKRPGKEEVAAMTHTPGPWKVFEGNKVEAGPFYFLQATRLGAHPNEWKANARLIAAAPALLEALEELVSELEDMDDYKRTEKARAVISQAKGEQQ